MRLIAVFVLFLAYSCSQNMAEVSKLSQIPRKDLARIEKLFSHLVWDETFAYVLFGNKPMSVCTQEKKLPSHHFKLHKSPVNELEALWKTWEKYAYFFPLKEFVFLIENDENLFSIYLLNRKNCLKVIEDNLPLFQKKMDSSLDAEGIFDHIVANAGNHIYKNSLHKSQGLYGILLGYGTENSLGFENHFSVNKDLGPLQSKSGQMIGSEDSVMPFIPVFTSFSAKETKNLIADYQRQRQEILNIYSNKNFLETTINRLTIERR